MCTMDTFRCWMSCSTPDLVPVTTGLVCLMSSWMTVRACDPANNHWLMRTLVGKYIPVSCAKMVYSALIRPVLSAGFTL